jgi:hypothetical protein
LRTLKVQEDDTNAEERRHAMQLQLRGRGETDALMVAIGDLKGVVSVQANSQPQSQVEQVTEP